MSPTDDRQILADHEALMKSGVKPPNPLSPAGRSYAAAAEREQARRAGHNVESVVKSQFARGQSGSASALHQRTAADAFARGDRAWVAVDHLMNSPGLMGGKAPTDEKRPEFDPRNPGDPAYFEAEAADQAHRAAMANGMAKAGQASALAKLKAHEQLRRDPIAVEAMRRTEAKAARAAKPVTAKRFAKQYRKALAKAGPVAKGGLVPQVIDLRVSGVGR